MIDFLHASCTFDVGVDPALSACSLRLRQQQQQQQQQQLCVVQGVPVICKLTRLTRIRKRFWCDTKWFNHCFVFICHSVTIYAYVVSYNMLVDVYYFT